MKTIGKIATDDGYVDLLLKTKKRYYRLIRTRSGNYYNIYGNDSAYGLNTYDYPLNKYGETIAACKDIIKDFEK